MASYNPYRDDIASDNQEQRPQSSLEWQKQQQQQQFGLDTQNDTFLSRIFGLNSIYNQLHENYQYYDPEFDSTDQQTQQLQQSNSNEHQQQQQDEEDESLLPVASSVINTNQEGIKIGGGGHSSLLDSESDSDLSSSSESYVRPKSNIEAEQEQEHKDSRRLKFNLPTKLTGKFKQDTILPTYTIPSQFRKPKKEQAENSKRRTTFVIPPKERALYLWANITNMDEFLGDVYYYYCGKGLANIIISRVIDLFILVFILLFTVFLKWGINYEFFIQWRQTQDTHITLSDLIISNFLVDKVPILAKFLLFGFFVYVILRIIQLYFDYNYKLREIRNFYYYLININDEELMTINWKTIVERLMLLKDYNSLTSTKDPQHYVNDLSSKVRLNAHDIANRIMRRENYMIAMMNKDVLDLTLFNNRFLSITQNSILTKTLEWNLKLCVDNFIYNRNGQVNPSILKDYNRNHLAKELSSRFKLAAMINMLLCPFIAVYFVLLYFYRYFNEFKSNPSSLVGSRQFTPFAHWKLREFNELPHFFNKRLRMSIGPANTYINQFPKGYITINVMKLVNFISGALLAILVIMGIWYEDELHSFWAFELTEGKSSLFYISIFGTIWAVTGTTTGNSSTEVSSSESFVYDPEASLRYVSQFTHYLPSKWNKKLHTIEVKNSFCELYSLKILLIMNEIFSIVFTPFILWFKISRNSGAIIDFFREYSIHVDGLGYVCYFAMFNFEEKDKNMMVDLNKRKKKHKKSKSKPMTNEIEMNKISKSDQDASSNDSSEEEPSDIDYMRHYQQDDKMIKSYMYFLESYGAGSQAQTKAKPTSQQVQTKKRAPVDPSPSFLYDQTNLSDSLYNINYKFDDSMILKDDMARRKGGVLGMLNQFYKQDLS
ncbi:Autophagy-related protein 9 [Spathaspora sp. JA1]|nr:Autophagy-related protein 9 [Spathaspora sp. JA1]